MATLTYQRRLLLGVAVISAAAGCGSKLNDVRVRQVEDWLAATTAAWASMKDSGNVDVLSQAFVQNGMVTSNTAVVVAFGPAAPALCPKEEPTVKAATKPAGPELAGSCIRVGQACAWRCEVSGLAPETEYSVSVEFAGDNHAHLLTNTRTAPIDVKSASVLLVSCNEPWSAGHVLTSVPMSGDNVMKHPRVALSSANGLALLALRATGKMPVSIDGRSWPQPSFLLGLGDQAYVDAEPERTGSLALFGAAHSDELRLSVSGPEAWPSILERIYRMHFRIPTFEKALQAIPNAMVWDDHEIRDGWGSHGDEDGTMHVYDNSAPEKRKATRLKWKDYFNAARLTAQAYEFSRNPLRVGEDLTRVTDLDTEISWGNQLRVFLMDTRTSRTTSLAQVKAGEKATGVAQTVSPDQLSRLEKFLKPCGVRPTAIVIGVPVPLTLGHEGAAPRFANSLQSDELADDYQDGWWWQPHDAQRSDIIKFIRTHAKQCPKDRIVVASGDLHESGTYAILDEGKVAAYEIVSSGIATLTGSKESVAKAEITPFGTQVNGNSHQVGRVGQGASLAELFFEFTDTDAPKLKVLFYATTGSDRKQDMDGKIVNAVWRKEATDATAWTIRSRTTQELFSTPRTRFGAIRCWQDTLTPALNLDYWIDGPAQGTNYGLSCASQRCRTSLDAISELAESWWLSDRRDACVPAHCPPPEDCVDPGTLQP